jgi:hypothetical protein
MERCLFPLLVRRELKNEGIADFEKKCDSGEGATTTVYTDECQSVPIFTLDQHRSPDAVSTSTSSSSSNPSVTESYSLLMNNNATTTTLPPMIHFLSIDVEGFDFEVLKGAAGTLSRVQYLEFEYNWVGPWGKQSLLDAVTMLKDQHNFVCFWMGFDRQLWRITDCWLEHYSLHFWSNVACVNTAIAEAAPLAKNMEAMFLETLNDTSVRFQ